VRYTELRTFAAKNFQAVENDRENLLFFCAVLFFPGRTDQQQALTLSRMFISESLTHKSAARLMAEQARQHDYVDVKGLHRIDRPTAGCEHFVGETLMQALRSVYSLCRIAVISALCSESRPLLLNCCPPTNSARTRIHGNFTISE